MELGNATNQILEHHERVIEEDDEKVVDYCALDPNICGMEAGCHNTGNFYICLCQDLRLAGPNNTCDRRKEVSSPSSTTDATVTDIHLQVAPTEGAFGSHQLLGMLSTSKMTPINGTDTNDTQYPNLNTSSAPTFSLQSTATRSSHSAAVVACVLALLLLATLGLMAYLRKGQWPSWFPGGRHGRASTAAALGKCMQQYVSNPNYYSGSPDAPLMKVLRNMEIPFENIVFMEEIGEGCFGKVHKGLYTLSSGITVPVAVKTLKDNASSEAKSDFEREVEIMSSFFHENILKLLGVVIKDNHLTPWMVFEFMQYGDLAQLLRSNSPLMKKSNSEQTLNLNQSDLIWISIQVANGMLYLSSQHFVHRDLATRNCLVGDGLTVKISDFGMSRDIYTSDYYKIGGSRMLPIRWMAPENITYGKFSLESDVWSYGVLLWEIFTYGKQPYYGHSNDEVVKLILQGILLSPPEDCPPFVHNIMAGCWKTEPRDRLTFPEIYELLVPNAPETRPQSQAPMHFQTEDEDSGLLVDTEEYLVPTAVTCL